MITDYGIFWSTNLTWPDRPVEERGGPGWEPCQCSLDLMLVLAKVWSQEVTKGTQACHEMGKTVVPTSLQRPVSIIITDQPVGNCCRPRCELTESGKRRDGLFFYVVDASAKVDGQCLPQQTPNVSLMQRLQLIYKFKRCLRCQKTAQWFIILQDNIFLYFDILPSNNDRKSTARILK